MHQTAPPAQLEAQQLARPRESDVAEDPVAPYISTSCSSSPGECLGLVSAVPEFVRAGRVRACCQPAAFASPLGERGGSREIAGFAFHNCLHNPGCCAHIPWLGLSGAVGWEAGGSVYTARWPLCSHYSNPGGSVYSRGGSSLLGSSAFQRQHQAWLKNKRPGGGRKHI